MCYGASVAKVDGHAGFMIILFALGLILAAFGLNLPAVVWIGMCFGLVIAVAWYWWCDIYHRVPPPDRLLEFVVLAIWCSVPAGLVGLVIGTLLRRRGDM
jgi:apolipoprotein N-acyltransferase